VCRCGSGRHNRRTHWRFFDRKLRLTNILRKGPPGSGFLAAFTSCLENSMSPFCLYTCSASSENTTASPSNAILSLSSCSCVERCPVDGKIVAAAKPASRVLETSRGSLDKNTSAPNGSTYLKGRPRYWKIMFLYGVKDAQAGVGTIA